MVRRHEVQLSISQLILYGVVVPEPESLMDPVLRGVDSMLEDEALVDQVLSALRGRFPGCITPPDGVYIRSAA